LKLRLICGNVIFPVVYDELLTLSRSHGWIYYKCGAVKDKVDLWDWSNLWNRMNRFEAT